jgi:hypothetical protein
MRSPPQGASNSFFSEFFAFSRYFWILPIWTLHPHLLRKPSGEAAFLAFSNSAARRHCTTKALATAPCAYAAPRASFNAAQIHGALHPCDTQNLDANTRAKGSWGARLAQQGRALTGGLVVSGSPRKHITAPSCALCWTLYPCTALFTPSRTATTLCSPGSAPGWTPRPARCGIQAPPLLCRALLQ